MDPKPETPPPTKPNVSEIMQRIRAEHDSTIKPPEPKPPEEPVTEPPKDPPPAAEPSETPLAAASKQEAEWRRREGSWKQREHDLAAQVASLTKEGQEAKDTLALLKKDPGAALAKIGVTDRASVAKQLWYAELGDDAPEKTAKDYVRQQAAIAETRAAIDDHKRELAQAKEALAETRREMDAHRLLTTYRSNAVSAVAAMGDKHPHVAALRDDMGTDKLAEMIITVGASLAQDMDDGADAPTPEQVIAAIEASEAKRLAPYLKRGLYAAPAKTAPPAAAAAKTDAPPPTLNGANSAPTTSTDPPALTRAERVTRAQAAAKMLWERSLGK